jgi:uncharacterized protein YjdB
MIQYYTVVDPGAAAAILAYAADPAHHVTVITIQKVTQILAVGDLTAENTQYAADFLAEFGLLVVPFVPAR